MTPVDTTLDDDLRTLRGPHTVGRCRAKCEGQAWLDDQQARDAAESRLRSRITALELENERLRGKL